VFSLGCQCLTAITYLRSLGATARLSRPSARWGWSEAESLDRVAASRRLAVVMAGVVPSVSFRSGICGRRHVAGARDPSATVRQSRPRAQATRLKNGNASAAADDPDCVFHRRAIRPAILFSRLIVNAISASRGVAEKILSHERRRRTVVPTCCFRARGAPRVGAGAASLRHRIVGDALGASRLPSAALRRFAVLTRPARPLDLAIAGASPRDEQRSALVVFRPGQPIATGATKDRSARVGRSGRPI
jgi:hypothetical protein